MQAQIFVPSLVAGMLMSGQGIALQASGTTVGVKPDAEAAGAEGLRIIKVKGPIYMGDVITTSVKGQVEIIFVDETKFVVGANSKVTIEAFVFDANKTAQDVSISAVKGAFRFITGKSPKDNYSIRTPTMTIGVRGTAFDLAVKAGSGESMVVVYEGSTDLCDALRRCSEGTAGSMSVGSAGGVRSVPAGRERVDRLNAYFPMVKSQVGLDPAFVVQVPSGIGSGGGRAASRWDGRQPAGA
jgi:ferric-dicitrate binding protein FerR (iron transport regulator)